MSKVFNFVRVNWLAVSILAFVIFASLSGHYEFLPCMAMATAKLQPFRGNTRQNIQKVGTLAYAANAAVSIELPRVGYLSRIFINFVTTGNGVTLSGAGTLTDKAPWNILNRIGVNFNVAAAKLIDVTGYGGFLISSKTQKAFRPDTAGAGSTTPHAAVYAAPVASGNNQWSLWWDLPIAANDGSNFEAGLINLQAPEVRVSLDLLIGGLTDAVALTTAIAGNFQIYMEYFEVPDPRKVMQPYPMLHRCLEDRINIAGVGQNVYTIPRQGNLLQLINVLTLNAARSESYDQNQIVFNKTTFPYQQERGLLRLRNRELNGFDWPTGVWDVDLFHANEEMSVGDGRDKIDTEEMSTIENVVVVSAGATLGSNNNFLDVVRKITQVFTS